MPPKRKVGRPKGSKNKKSRGAANGIKSTDPIQIEENGNKSPSKNDRHSCTKSFESAINLRRHKRMCKKLEINKSKYDNRAVDINPIKCPYSCKDCNKRFKFKNSYDLHIQSMHSELPDSVGCNKCNVRCPDPETLQKHIEDVHDRELFECPHCKKTFARSGHVKRHLAQKGCDGKGISFYLCEICNANFTRKDNLIMHLRVRHIFKKEFTCKECPYNTHKYSKLINHVQKMHSDEPQRFECHHCGKVTGSRVAIAKHLEIHGEKKFACDVCGYTTHTIEVMRRHVLTHVKDKPFKCSLCDCSYIQRQQLERHLEKHSGFMCVDCGDTFTSKLKLIIHKREHKGLQKLMCSFENCTMSKKEFGNEASLHNHLKLHIEDKTYECGLCYKRFSSETYLRRHLVTHALDRPRRCMYCVVARAYVRGEQLLRHVRKHHPDVFRAHLTHVRQVLGSSDTIERVKKSELESILNVLDAESDRVLQGCGAGVLYGGLEQDSASATVATTTQQVEDNPLMSEEELAENLRKLLAQLIDKDTLECFGWPDECIDEVLEKVIEKCGARVADRERWTRVQRLRENTKHLFLYAIEDKAIARMLDTHTIDQIVKHILAQVSDEDNPSAADSASKS